MYSLQKVRPVSYTHLLAYRLYLEGDQEYGRKFESLCQIIEKIPGNKTNFKWLQLKSEMEEDLSLIHIYHVKGITRA